MVVYRMTTSILVSLYSINFIKHHIFYSKCLILNYIISVIMSSNSCVLYGHILRLIGESEALHC